MNAALVYSVCFSNGTSTGIYNISLMISAPTTNFSDQGQLEVPSSLKVSGPIFKVFLVDVDPIVGIASLSVPDIFASSSSVHVLTSNQINSFSLQNVKTNSGLDNNNLVFFQPQYSFTTDHATQVTILASISSKSNSSYGTVYRNYGLTTKDVNNDSITLSTSMTSASEANVTMYLLDSNLYDLDPTTALNFPLAKSSSLALGVQAKHATTSPEVIFVATFVSVLGISIGGVMVYIYVKRRKERQHLLGKHMGEETSDKYQRALDEYELTHHTKRTFK
eukprot:TRINITY_DN10904_c0_g1_i1.p1 TRINITY_DN10904_c0_g1~~TRINITY_DN10904_c0_g1_i1.p1  ORF type:complete len:315 (-),score=75.30 TRINITY_DN10904_c0_g1_i1:53-886(-)